MTWLVGGVVYALAYVAVVWLAAAHPAVRLWAGNLGLLVSPVVAIVVILRRRRAWIGRQRVFWMAIAAGAALWLAGQLGWATDELLLGRELPWLNWPIVLQLCGSLMPLVALVAVPHRGPRSEASATASLDAAVATVLLGFLFWSLIIAPGLVPATTVFATHVLVALALALRVAAVVALVGAAIVAGNSPWATVYRRIAAGLAIAVVLLAVNSMVIATGAYHTGSAGDAGWMLPFWFYAWAASTGPRSEIELRPPIAHPRRLAFPILKFAAILIVPLFGFGMRYGMPEGEPIDTYRELATDATLLCGIAALMWRLRIEQRITGEADDRVRLLAAACEQATELILIMRGNVIEYANNAFCNATGYSLEELEVLPAEHLVADESARAVPGIINQLRTQEVAHAAGTVTRQDGSTFQAECTVAPLVDAGGGVTHHIAIVRDLTEQMRLRDQLVRSERLSAIGELASGVAHEINSPLQLIVGTVDLLLGRAHQPEVRADLEKVRHESDRAVKIIRTLLAFVRKSPRERLLGDLNEIVRATVALRAYELANAGIQLSQDYAFNLPLVLVNREEVQQIILNLVLNAEQAILAAHRPGRIAIRTYLNGTDAICEVADDGIGVPPEVQNRIFEPFFTTRELDEEAIGLGLSIAFGIATAHGGTLELVPSDIGACFRLTLPGAGFPGPAHTP